MNTAQKIAALVSSASLFGVYLFFQTRSVAKPPQQQADAAASQPAAGPTTNPADPKMLISSSKYIVLNPNTPADPKMLISTSKSIVVIDPKHPTLLSGSKSAAVFTPPAAPAVKDPTILMAGSKSRAIIPTGPATQPTTKPAAK